MDDNDPNQNDRRDGIDKVFDRIGDAFNKIAKGSSGGSPAAPASGSSPQGPGDVDAFFRAVRRAVKSKETAEVKKFIDAGFNPDTQTTSGDTALHMAARDNALALGKLLLEAGANPRIGYGGDAERTPLADAINFGKPDMAELLTRHGGYKPGETGANGLSLLHRACEKGKTGVVEAMIKAGADANERTGNGSTPLMVAISRRQPEVAEKLLDYPAVAQGMNEYFAATDVKKRTAFQLAVEKGAAPLVAKMMAFGTNVNAADADGVTPLFHAIQKSNLDLVRTLIAEGADVNRASSGGETPLFVACHTSEISDPKLRAAIAACLVRHGADPALALPGTKQTPLHAAAQLAQGAETVAALLQFGRPGDNYDAEGATPLFYAARKADAGVLRQLLQAGADPDARHRQDARTPLIEAVQENSAGAVKTLLEHGANPALLDAQGKSPLSYARAKKLDAVILLLEEALEKKAQPVPTARKPHDGKFQEWSL